MPYAPPPPPSTAAHRHVALAALRASLHRALPRASCRALAVVDAMLLTEGAIGSAGSVAKRLGFHSRFELARWLAREGLPPLHELAGWLSVLVWVDLCRRTSTSLCALALYRGRDPSVCYRLVQRLTGRAWSEVRALGLRWVLERFRGRCGDARSRRVRWLSPVRRLALSQHAHEVVVAG